MLWMVTFVLFMLLFLILTNFCFTVAKTWHFWTESLLFTGASDLKKCVSPWEGPPCRGVEEEEGMNGKRRGLGGGGDAWRTSLPVGPAALMPCWPYNRIASGWKWARVLMSVCVSSSWIIRMAREWSGRLPLRTLSTCGWAFLKERKSLIGFIYNSHSSVLMHLHNRRKPVIFSVLLLLLLHKCVCLHVCATLSMCVCGRERKNERERYGLSWALHKQCWTWFLHLASPD